jgi:hypothetical protein
MTRTAKTLALALLTLGLASCAKESAPSEARTGGPFEVLKTAPANNGQLYLNQTVRWTMSNPIDVTTADFNSVVFTAFDSGGNPLSENVTGSFRNGLDVNGVKDPYVLEFVPTLPANNTFSDGGFKPGRIYNVTIARSNQPNDKVLRDAWSNPLWEFSSHQALAFKTASGNTPAELFLDTKIGGPRVDTWSAGPKVGDKVALNRLGDLPVEITLNFNQPLNPSDLNLPVRQDLDPLLDNKRNKGRIYLRYDDASQNDVWIRAEVLVTSNDALGATVVLRPDGVLPNNATIEIVVAAELEDISGESNVKDRSYEPVIGSFRTEEVFGSQFDALMFTFKNGDLLDPTVPFNDPVASLEQGLLKASFEFEGQPTKFNWSPTSREVVLDTNFQIVQPSNGPPIAVSGGVFSFNDIEIKKDIVVRSKGSNPLVFLANGSVKIAGHLNVDGGDGAQVNTLQSANFPTGGGAGVAGGGNGGKASQNITGSTQQGESGFGPNQVRNGGGEGGQILCGADLFSSAHFTAGGGGGSFATKGDPNAPDSRWGGASTTSRPQLAGKGGDGANKFNKPLGGAAGPLAFTDSESNNDFWGRLVTEQGEVVLGELQAPVGGSGGGGGGDTTAATVAQNCSDPDPQKWIKDRKGGGGGGGAGILIIKALGTITVEESGLISANGGYGGGGEWAGSSTYGGGGGAGSGGMVVLMSSSRIDIHQHTDTYKNKDTSFALSADGAISRVSAYTSVRKEKYIGYTTYKNNAGGFGGMGVVQLMTPPGTDADGTNNNLDDNVRIIKSDGKPATGIEKTNWLFDGDIRPDPTLLPVSYGRFSAAVTKWRSTLFTERQEKLNPQVDDSRVIDSQLGTSGPEWYFSQLQTSGTGKGYLATDDTSGALLFPPQTLLGGKTKAGIESFRNNGAVHYGTQAHVVRLDGTYLNDPLKGGWSFANYRAKLFDGNGSQVGEYRILAHDDRELMLEAGIAPLPEGIKTLSVHAKFIGLETEGAEGLGKTYGITQGVTTKYYPLANLRVGFAFHKNPAEPDITGNEDANRFPKTLGTYLYELDLTNAAVREQLRKLHYRFARAEMRFNLNYNPESPDTTPGPNPVQPGVERPGIRFLNLPYRF